MPPSWRSLSAQAPPMPPPRTGGVAVPRNAPVAVARCRRTPDTTVTPAPTNQHPSSPGQPPLPTVSAMDPAKAEFLFDGVPDHLDLDDPDQRADLMALDPDDPMSGARSAMRAIVAEQIIHDDPPAVWATAQRLRAIGMDRSQVMAELAMALGHAAQGALAAALRMPASTPATTRRPWSRSRCPPRPRSRTLRSPSSPAAPPSPPTTSTPASSPDSAGPSPMTWPCSWSTGCWTGSWTTARSRCWPVTW